MPHLPGDRLDAAVYAALAESRRETARIKAALRRWQTDQAGARNERGRAR